MGSPGPGDCSGEKGRLKDLAKATMPLLTKLVLLSTSCWTLGAAHPLRGKDLRRATQRVQDRGSGGLGLSAMWLQTNPLTAQSLHFLC